jgi:hypothetical protein
MAWEKTGRPRCRGEILRMVAGRYSVFSCRGGAECYVSLSWGNGFVMNVGGKGGLTDVRALPRTLGM